MKDCRAWYFFARTRDIRYCREKRQRIKRSSVCMVRCYWRSMPYTLRQSCVIHN